MSSCNHRHERIYSPGLLWMDDRGQGVGMNHKGSWRICTIMLENMPRKGIQQILLK